MPRPSRVPVIAMATGAFAVTSLLAGGVLFAQTRNDDDDSTPDETLGDALLLADLRYEDHTSEDEPRDIEAISQSLSEGEQHIDGTYVGGVTLLPGPDRTFYLRTPHEHHEWPDGAFIHINHDGTILDIVEATRMGEEAATSDGRIATAGLIVRDDTALPPHVGWLDSPDDWNEFDNPHRTEPTPSTRPETMPLYGLTVTDDGTFLVAYMDPYSYETDTARIDAVTPDGTQTHLVGPPGDDDATIHTDGTLMSFDDLVTLPDGTIATVAMNVDRDRFDLYIIDLDNQELSPLQTDAPVPADSYGNGLLGPVIDVLSPGPDGTLIVVGTTEPDDPPTITQVDPATGETDTLTTLEGIDLSRQDTEPDHQIAAAAVGDDLVILARERLWLLENAFAE